MKKRFYAVIHVEDFEQVSVNAAYAYENGADGIFLINHSLSCEDLLEIYHDVRKKYPDQWIGLNFLGPDAARAMQMLPADADGLWTDNAEIDEDGPNIIPGQWYADFKKTHPRSSYFGGVAFKYQRHVENLECAAKEAQLCMDVICSSGAGTGIAANVDHVRRLCSGKGDRPLALASGVTPENIHTFLPYADCFLVATGVSRSFRMLDPQKVKLLAEKIRAYNEKMLSGNRCAPESN